VRTLGFSCAVVGAALVLVACPSTVDGSGVSADAGGDSATTPPEDATTPDASDGALAFSVKELPAPMCHDLTQRGGTVVVSASPMSPPAASPINTIPSGLYVATTITEYETPTTAEPAEQITIFVTSSRYYYTAKIGDDVESVSTTWNVSGGSVDREMLCSSKGRTGTFKNRVDAAPNGFLLHTTSNAQHPLVIRYERVP
jgi:hypothetical protein